MKAVSGSCTRNVSSIEVEALFRATLVILVVAYLATMVDSMWNLSYTTVPLLVPWRVLRTAEVNNGSRMREVAKALISAI